MNYLVVPLQSVMASFRDPDFQNFHRTLPLPPPATCIGMAGAALGLSPEDSQAFFTEGEWELGVKGESDGRVADLWKYNDFKQGSILLREYLVHSRFLLVFGHHSEEKISALHSAFQSPVYALSCGNSDSVCRVDPVLTIINGSSEGNEVATCYLAGDFVKSVVQQGLESEGAFSIQTSSNPIAQDLPVRFEYLKDGIRRLRQRRLLSYVQYPALLPNSIKGIHYTPVSNSSRDATTVFIPTFPL